MTVTKPDVPLVITVYIVSRETVKSWDICSVFDKRPDAEDEVARLALSSEEMARYCIDEMEVGAPYEETAKP